MKIEKIAILLMTVTLILISCRDKEITEPGSYAVSISVKLMEEFATEPEWIHLQIVKNSNDEIVYDTIAIVTLEKGFNEELILKTGSYKCFIPDMGAMVQMPIIKLYDGEIVEWGYPEIDAFVFDLPAN